MSGPPNLRTLLPNSTDATLRDSSTSTSNNQKITPDTSSAPSISAVRTDKRSEKSSHITKKRRIPSSITANACGNCKKARSKCDGQHPCGRCAGKGFRLEECIYEPHTKNAKRTLVRDLKESHRIKRSAEKIFECLVSNTENEHEILERIKNKESIQSIAEWLDSIDSNGESQLSTYAGSDHETVGGQLKDGSWTTVTHDEGIISHLMNLYFTWVHPFHPLFNEGHFVKSMRSGSNTFCSHSLFNAICAMACYLHTGVEDGDENEDENENESGDVDYKQMAVQFSDLVRSIIDPEDRNLTNIQAFAVMFLVRCAQGQGLNGSIYLAVASRCMESLQPSDNDHVDYRQIWRETVKGINSLSVEWAQMTFKMAPAFIPELQPTQDAEEVTRWEEEVDKLRWKQYRFPLDLKGEPTLSCLTATTNREKSKLIEIIHDATILLYDKTDAQIYAEDMLAIYRRLLVWRENLPEMIANTGKKEAQMLPHVLSLHILYATTAVQLLRPMMDMGEPSIEKLVWDHAQDGLNLIDDRYRFQYTCRYQPVSQMFALLHFTEVMIRYSPGIDKEIGKDRVALIKLATDILRESHSSFPVADVLVTMLQETTRKFLVPLPNELEDLFRRRCRKFRFLLDDAINACANPTHLQPVETIRRRFSLDLPSKWMIHGSFGYPRIPHALPMSRQPPQLSEEERGARDLLRILNFRNKK